MPDFLGDDMRKTKEGKEEEKEIKSLDEADIALLKTYPDECLLEAKLPSFQLRMSQLFNIYGK